MPKYKRTTTTDIVADNLTLSHSDNTNSLYLEDLSGYFRINKSEFMESLPIEPTAHRCKMLIKDLIRDKMTNRNYILVPDGEMNFIVNNVFSLWELKDFIANEGTRKPKSPEFGTRSNTKKKSDAWHRNQRGRK